MTTREALSQAKRDLVPIHCPYWRGPIRAHTKE